MQAAFTSLPELPRRRHQTVTSPMGWSWDLALAKARGHLGKLFEQSCPTIDHPALGGRPRAQLAVARSGRKIGVRFFITDWRYRTGYGDLPVQLVPGKQHRSLRKDLQSGGLTTFIVGVEHQTPLINTLHQHHTLAQRVIRLSRCQSAGGWVGQPSGDRLLLPANELCHWVCRKVFAAKATKGV